ncbi:LysR family transcriptional regulator [Bordetella tumbae]|uniref:LysR family transcriptional regulator n=1 Tax=Bordetella tumbae TaxID=1649139 RepID=UPI0039EF0D2B
MADNAFSINHYRYFLWVAETGSFRLAAERAHRSQPAISLAIREMEERLGQKLFVRGSPVVPTAFGISCLTLAQQLVDHADQVSSTMGSIARNDSGFLSMACVMSAATHWMPGLVRSYRQRYPNVMLNIRDDNSEGVEQMLLRGQAELGICSTVSDNSALSFQPLFKDEFGLVCHRDHPLATAGRLTWKDIAHLPHIGTVAHRQLASCPQAAFLSECRLYIANMLTLIAMLRQQMGVTVLARLGLPPDQNELTFVPLDSPGVERTLGLRMRADRTLSPAAEYMRQLVLAEIGHSQTG